MSTAQELNEEKEYWRKVEILQTVASELQELLGRRLEDTDITDVECDEFLGESIVCNIGRKYLALSEVVAQGMEQHCAEVCEEENLSEEECEKRCEEEFQATYEEELDRINEEHVIGVEASIDASLCAITVNPLLCDEDDCFVGAQAWVAFKVDVEHLRDKGYREYLLNKIAEVISTILREL